MITVKFNLRGHYFFVPHGQNLDDLKVNFTEVNLRLYQFVPGGTKLGQN